MYQKLLYQKVRVEMIKEKIIALVKKDDKPNKKKVENLIFTVVLLIVTLLVVKNAFKSDKKVAIENTVVPKEIQKYRDEQNIEKELEDILAQIKGVEKVKVLVTYSETEQVVPLYNESTSKSSTEERDVDGGERSIENYDISKEVVADGNQYPITEKVVFPRIEGAIVIAKGAENTVVKDNITNAVSAATGLAVHKIQVLEMR